MARKKASEKRKGPVLLETSESIALQTEAFLANGGEVTVVQRGVSGQEPITGKKHITYAKKP